MINPLLVSTADPGRPAFGDVRPEHAEPAIDVVLAENREKLQSVLATASAALASGREPTWAELVEPLDEMSERLARAWGPVSHLFGVTSTSEWRAAYNACLPKVTAYQIELSQNEALCLAYEGLAKSKAVTSEPRAKVIRDALREFRLSGVGLPEADRARFRAIAMRLSELSAKFQENVLDAVQAWSKELDSDVDLAGMTEQGKAAAQAKARAKGARGYRLTLDFPSYDAVITYASDRALRREIYEAYATRASDQGPLAGRFDNGPLMTEILALRQEQASLLGYDDYAAMSLATKMAKSAADVESFLLDLNKRARPRAEAELAELRSLARKLDNITDLEPWDLPYYSEKWKAQTLGFSQDDLRPYFQAPRVIEGMFKLVERLYGIVVEPISGVATWHPDVTTYGVFDPRGVAIGVFYLDPYARDDKRGGAWMDECVGRRKTTTHVQMPIAYLTCNFAPPLPNQPALLTHDEVRTLFHEFGHGLHHLLTRVDEPAISGIRGVEWDAVELPSQFMENWCFDPTTLRGFARHYQTGETLPDDLLDRLRAGRTLHAALATIRQVEFALFDLRVHRATDRPSAGVPNDVLAVIDEVRREVSLLPPPSWNRMPSSFSHIFAGGYAAGYYSYKWAEVLSADAFAAFEEAGFSVDVGRRFRETVLARGGSREAMDLFVEFRGRRPSLEPLLKQTGLAMNRT